MRHYSNSLSYLFLSALLIVFSCNRKVDFLTEAKEKLNNSNYIGYAETAFYPIPETDLIDTIHTQTEVVWISNDSVGYHFIQMGDRGDRIYQGKQLQVTNHSERTVRTYLPEHFKSDQAFRTVVKDHFRDRWSPMVLLKEEWDFVADTMIDGTQVKNYYQVENDKMYEGHKIYTEHHIFINTNALIERFERRNYYDGSLSQRIIIDFSDYSMTQGQKDMSYSLPENYVSTYGIEKKLESLNEGEMAPDFVGVNMEGDSVSNKMFQGKKVLLNFSVIGCGYCKKTLDYINQEDYELTNNIDVLYINPEDDSSRMELYMKKMNVPFPIIASAKDIAHTYRVDSYPRFFLIDEQGVIEKIQFGFSKEFLDEFRQ